MRYKALCLVIAITLVFLSLPGIALADGPIGPTWVTDPVSEALAWLAAQQNDDGGFGDPESSPGTTAQAVLGIAAVYENASAWQKDSSSPLDYLASKADEYTSTGWDPASSTALLIQAVVAADGNPYNFGGINLVERLDSFFSASTNQFTGSNWAIASYILAKIALLEEPNPDYVQLLKDNQLPSGGWEYSAGWGADSNTTALAVQALVAAGEPLTSTAIVSATSYFHSIQNEDGGFPYAKPSPWGTETDANSTAMVIQALIAAGENPLAPSWEVNGNTPVDALLALQQRDGSFYYKADDPGSQLLATIQALPALVGRPFPLRGRYVAVHKALEWLQAQQQDDGGFGSAGTTADVVLAAVSAWTDPSLWLKNGKSPIDYLEDQAIAYTTPYTYTWGSNVYTATAVAQTGKLAVAAVAAGAVDIRTDVFGGITLSQRLDENLAWSPADLNNLDRAWAILGYVALGETVPGWLLNDLKAQQLPSGGWEYSAGWGADSNTTALAVQALIAAGEPLTSTAIVSATSYFRTIQNDDGGFPYAKPSLWGTETDANSTGMVLQALAALGEDPLTWLASPDGQLTVHSPLEALLALQQLGGAFNWKADAPGSQIMATAQALPGIMGQAFPIRRFRVYLPLVIR